MAIPLGSLSGTEVLRRGRVYEQSTTVTTLKFDGGLTPPGQASNVVPANHIITIISMIFCEQASSQSERIILEIEAGSLIKLLESEPLAPGGTFVWNERISLVGGDAMRFAMVTAANVDLWYSYIDQSWV